MKLKAFLMSIFLAFATVLEITPSNSVNSWVDCLTITNANFKNLYSSISYDFKVNLASGCQNFNIGTI